MPSTMLNWNSATRRPLERAGAISEMYIGAATDDAPTPRPPMKRKNMNEYSSGATADPTADTKYNTPTQNSVFFLPSMSTGMPANSAPTTVPYNAAATANPCDRSSNYHTCCMVCSTPEMTAVSNPKRKPPIAATREISVTFLFMFGKFSG